MADAIDLKLPYFWYLQGSLIEEHQFEEDVGHPREYYITSDRSSRRMMTVPKSSIPGDLKETVEENIISLVQYYRQPNGYFKKGYVDLLLDDVYAKAPYEFQRVFNRKFIPYLETLKNSERMQDPASFSFENDEQEKIESFLDASLRVFPQDDMEQIYNTYLEWDDTIRITLDYEEKKIFQMSDNFWNFFCHDLRILQNENLSPKLIQHWNSRFIENILPKYESGLEKLRKSLLKKWKAGQDEDREIDGLVAKLNHLSRDHFERSGNEA
ncbi:hypothetical protein [Methanoregula sp.]|uniref:hypothetical protein n=1 Tax=Methanoregula sp. TaxID=2052170 RepID=UPI0026345684|nr:hypothetical protein [Methanoregula sp.]MDD5141804.1 hypothetical protein [Methanoregula sp.]